MCHDPGKLLDGTIVACRKCELCLYNRVKDWAGRNIAQSKVSIASFACDLTYGPELDSYPVGHAGKYGMPIPGRSDHIRAAVLTYEDVQKFLKYLRDALGYRFQYFVTGEYGALNGRAHWHIIFHFLNRVPPHEEGVNFSDRHVNEFGRTFKHDVCAAWPHGFMFWKRAAFQDVFYNCKYILKDEEDEEAQRKPGLSKKPPIGTEYFYRLADLYVQEEVAPQSREYQFPEIRKDDGSPMVFMLKGRTLELYLQRYIDRWKQVHGQRERPKSNLVDWFEKYGKVVTDEDAYLLRLEFPKGESKQPIPSGKKIKQMAAEAKAERAEVREQLQEAMWIGSARDGEERQRRQGHVEWNEHVREQDRLDFIWYKEQYGFFYLEGKWVRDRARSGEGGDEQFPEWVAKYGTAVRAAIAGELREWQQPEPTGPVGKWNRHFGYAEQRPHIGGADDGAAKASRAYA